MALLAIESVREAELSAQKSIEHAQTESEQAITQVRQKASDIINTAREKAQQMIDGSIDRARKDAEEITVTAHNSAVLEAEKLRQASAEKQQAVNEKILQLIIN